MTGESLTPEQAHELLELMSKGDGFDQGMDSGTALTLADIALQIGQPERAEELRHAVSMGEFLGPPGGLPAHPQEVWGCAARLDLRCERVG